MEEILSNATKRFGRAGIASLATTALVASGLTAFAGAASASEPVDFKRIAGQDRYATSAAAAAAFGATDNALLASGEQGHFVDSLSANFLAGVRTAPILLTEQDDLPEVVADQIEASGITEVTIIGGELAVGPEVVAELEAMGVTVSRVFGQNRFETNEAVIEAGSENGGNDNTALVATGFNFPDALGAGPIAYDGLHPVAISKTDDMPDAIIAALKEAGVTEAIIVGGPLAVSEDVENELEANDIDVVTRINGANRADTSVKLAEYAIANLGFTANEIDFASGRDISEGVDALSGGPVSGKEQTPILITRNEDRAPELVSFLSENCDVVDSGDIYGGPLALTEALEQELEAAAQCEVTSNQDFTATPSEAATNTVSDGTTANDNRGQRQYDVTGLDNAVDYDLYLFPAENVQVDANGVVTFDDNDGTGNAGNDVADYSATAGVFEVVNGASVTDNNGSVVDVSPVNGAIEFSIDSQSVDQVVPVLIAADTASSDTNPDVDLNADNEPTELFAIGGQKNWVAPEASIGAVGADELVNAVNKAADNFATNNGTPTDATDDVTYFYDANDEYFIESGTPGTFNPVSLATFEAALSRGDVLDQTSVYAPDPDAESTFRLQDDAPAGPANVTASAIDSDTIRVTWDAVTGADSYNIYRVADTTPANCSTTLSDYSQVATVDGAAARTYDDNGLDAGTGYCYTVTAVVDGDESGINSTDGDTTAAAGATVAPLSTDAYIVQDNNGELDAGDSFRVVFNEQMRPVDADDRIQLTDNQGELVNLYCGGAAGGAAAQDSEVTCELNTADVTVNGTTYGPGRVLTVATLATGEDYAADNTVTGGDGVVDYPATVTAQAGITDLDGNGWNLADSPDRVVDDEAGPVESGTFAGDTVAPTVTDADAVDATTATTTVDEAVTSLGGGPVDFADFAYDADGAGAGPAVPATGATISEDGLTITLTFPAGTVDTAVNAVDIITYTDDSATADAGDPVDFAGNQLADEAGELVDDVA